MQCWEVGEQGQVRWDGVRPAGRCIHGRVQTEVSSGGLGSSGRCLGSTSIVLICPPAVLPLQCTCCRCTGVMWRCQSVRGKWWVDAITEDRRGGRWVPAPLPSLPCLAVLLPADLRC